MAAFAPMGSPERRIERLAFFSDAVFAIALTLLAIDLRLPEGTTVDSSESFMTALGAAGPRLYSFVLSFVVIFIFWGAHFRIFRVVTEVDGLTVLANMLLLLCVAFLPFPTSVLGAHPTVPAVVAFYGICVGVTGLASTLLWVVVAEVRHHAGDLPPRVIHLLTARSLFVPVVMFALAPVAFVDASLVRLVWIFIVPAQMAFERVFERRMGVRPWEMTIVSPDAPAGFAVVSADGRDAGKHAADAQHGSPTRVDVESEGDGS